QNVFESFVQDSYVGSWRADEVADRLIEQALIPEIIIVGVSHGNEDRIKEYLPPFSQYPFKPQARKKAGSVINGMADQTADYYMQDVAKYVQKNYRASADPALVATCGSSMGGLISLYIAWNYPEFAYNHAALSPSIWATLNDQRQYEIIERFGDIDSHPNLRLWIDSGQFAAERQGNDGQAEVKIARDKLLAHGFKSDEHFAYRFYEGATHSEGAWSGRLDEVMRFLFPFQDPK
ncbi:MAG: alpha/beta hydrolase-fold protein, partial [Chloroflexota bacterium]